jgi:hypothetical protein
MYKEKRTRAAMRPDQFFTKPINVMHRPQRILKLVSYYFLDIGRDAYMMIGMKIEGRRRFNSTFVRGSKTEYETKKIERAALYMPVDSLRLVSRWAILAFPMFVLSRKDSRYRRHSYSDQHFAE